MPSAAPVTRLGALVVAVALAATLGGCQSAEPEEPLDPDAIRIGTVEPVRTLDPACSYDPGSFLVMNQVYPFLLTTPPGSAELEPDLAATAAFTAPNQYTVTLEPGLTFANGNDLTASDVVFSFERQLAIADPGGPSGLLYNLQEVSATDETTVVFTLRSDRDQTFPHILASMAGPIVDEDVMSPGSCTSDEAVVAGGGFAGQYAIGDYEPGEHLDLVANDAYAGSLGDAETDAVRLEFFADSASLRLALQEGGLDVAYRGLAAGDVAELRGTDGLQVTTGPSGQTQYLVFNLNTQPFGATTSGPDAGKALAVRQAIANLVDRTALASEVYLGTATPLYSYVPVGLPGAIQPFVALYGNGAGGPNPEQAAARLANAGIATPVELELHYVDDRYGPLSAAAYELISAQLETDGLFDVSLKSSAWAQYREERYEDYPAYQLGWFPDYADADNYLTPFFLSAGNFPSNHYANSDVNQLVIDQSVAEDPAARQAAIELVQTRVAEDVPLIPLLEELEVVVAQQDVSGVVLDASTRFRFGLLEKS